MFATDSSSFLQLTFSPRNSPTFKSFEEKVETTVTSLKVKVRNRVTWLGMFKCDSIVVPIIYAGDRLNFLFRQESDGTVRALWKAKAICKEIVFLCFFTEKSLLFSAKVNKWSQKCQKIWPY